MIIQNKLEKLSAFLSFFFFPLDVHKKQILATSKEIQVIYIYNPDSIIVQATSVLIKPQAGCWSFDSDGQNIF